LSTGGIEARRSATWLADTSCVHPQLSAVAAGRLGVFTSQEALRVGYRVEDIRAELGTRRWSRLRKGVYIRTDRLVTADTRQRHLMDCVAVLLSLGAGPVLSHASAARLHELVLPWRHSSEVRVTAVDQWRRGRGYRVAHAAMTADETEPWMEFGATSIPRTLVDCAREWSLTDGVVAIDAALNEEKATRAELIRAVLGGTHRIGIAQAARALNLSDGRAESPLETRGRLAMLASGLPQPALQVEIHDAAGIIGRVDAWYDDAAVAIEFDGQVKYTDPRYASSPGEVLWKEKRREDRLRAVGVRVVRVVNEDLGSPWPRTAALIGGLLAAPYVGPRRFRAVHTDEPGGASDAA
jgi:predicted transcriptional regulator of viral defense system